MYDTTMPDLNPDVVTERFQSLLAKFGPTSTDGSVVRTTPMPTVVGEMCRQFLCRLAEFESGAPYFATEETIGFRSTFEQFLVDECHAPGDLIWQFIENDHIGLLGFAVDNSLHLPNRLVCQIASEIVGYHDHLRDLNGGKA